jgi:hypothetical protein
MQPSRTTGIGALSLGVTVLAGVLVGDVTTTTSNYWCRPPVIALIGISALLLTVGGWALGGVYLGWRWPKTHVERTAEREQERERKMFAFFGWRDAVWMIEDELIQHQRDLRIELDNDRVYGGFHDHARRNANQHVFNEPRFAETRGLVQEAYAQTHELNRRNKERWDAASHDDANDPEWRRLKDDERREREEALEAVEKALRAVTTVRESEPQP